MDYYTKAKDAINLVYFDQESSDSDSDINGEEAYNRYVLGGQPNVDDGASFVHFNSTDMDNYAVGESLEGFGPKTRSQTADTRAESSKPIANQDSRSRKRSASQAGISSTRQTHSAEPTPGPSAEPTPGPSQSSTSKSQKHSASQAEISTNEPVSQSKTRSQKRSEKNQSLESINGTSRPESPEYMINEKQHEDGIQMPKDFLRNFRHEDDALEISVRQAPFQYQHRFHLHDIQYLLRFRKKRKQDPTPLFTDYAGKCYKNSIV